ncbi:MAG: CoA pyrophosphatase [Candidatus Binatia bacterium]
MGIAHIRLCLGGYRPRAIDELKVGRAAVALVLAEAADGIELLLIERATRDGDPWSGHMAFPGGRRHPDDADATATAVRETREEVGVALDVDADAIGRLDDVRAVAHRGPLDLVITPIVFALRRPVAVHPSPREVQSAVWVPLHFLGAPGARATYRRTGGGDALAYPCFRFQGYTIWGLTHRILDNFLDIVRDDGPVLG